jgi:hypothetical protein
VSVYLLDAYIYHGFRDGGARAHASSGRSSAAQMVRPLGGCLQLCRRRRRQLCVHADDTWVLARVVLSCLMAADVALALVTLLGHGDTLTFRFSRVLRPFIYATRKRGAKQVLTNVVSAVPDQGTLLVGILAVIMLWSFVGFLLFRTLDPTNFGSAPDAFVAMLTVFTAPSFNQQLLNQHMAPGGHQWAALFFVSFLVVANMFLLRLITAVAFESFQKFARTERVAVGTCLRLLLSVTCSPLFHRICAWPRCFLHWSCRGLVRDGCG